MKTCCPFINTLINENILKKTTDISSKELQELLKQFLDPALVYTSKENIISLFTNKNDIIPNILDINKHGILEHDASLTRLDAFNGDNVSFNPNMLKKMLATSSNKYLTLDNLITYRKSRIINCRIYNPSFKFGITELTNSCIETSMLMLLFSDETKQIRKDWLEYFFINEKFPYHLGWKTRQMKFLNLNVLTVKQVTALLPSILNINSFFPLTGVL